MGKLGWVATAALAITFAAQTGWTQGPPAAQATPRAAQPGTTNQPGTATQPASGQTLQLQTLTPETRSDPFPPVNPKYFTAATPTTATVDAFVKALFGFDANRIWRVEGILKTTAPGVSQVIVYLSERTAGAKVQTAVFYTTPDGKHVIGASSGVAPFGDHPFADDRATLAARANGPSTGAAGKDLELVVFSNFQCVRCKAADTEVQQLRTDFPKAHVVFESLPQPELYPYGDLAAAYGICLSRSKPDAFPAFEREVFATQGMLKEDTADQTLQAAVAKAGGDANAAAACAVTPATRDEVQSASKLAADLGVIESPMVAINGRLLPLGNVNYDTLKRIIAWQAEQDGVSAAAAGPGAVGLTVK